MATKRSQKKAGRDRQRNASLVQSKLSKIVAESRSDAPVIRQNAATNLLALNRRHRLKMPKNISLMLCKKCNVIYNSKNSRTRIKHGQLIKTCLECDYVRRLGGGPKSHRRR